MPSPSPDPAHPDDPRPADRGLDLLGRLGDLFPVGTGSVTRRIHAPVERIWDLVADVERIGELSPETFEAEWSDGGDADVTTPGRRFRGHVRRNGRGPTYWTECVVSDLVPQRRFGFDVVVGHAVINHWQYDLEPVDDATTDVTESFRLADHPLTRAYWGALGRWRSSTNERGMATTLERVATIVEDDPADVA